jgi:hypothetical protein
MQGRLAMLRGMHVSYRALSIKHCRTDALKNPFLGLVITPCELW